MKRWLFCTAALLGLGASAYADEAREAPIASGPEQVDTIPALTGLYSWTPVDRDAVIVWATPFRPYLIELSTPSQDLPFTEVIGVTQVGGRVYAKFDSVYVRGLRYPIRGIYKLTRDEARHWNETT